MAPRDHKRFHSAFQRKFTKPERETFSRGALRKLGHHRVTISARNDMDFPDSKAVVHYHRSQLSQAAFQSPEVDDSIWGEVGDEGRYLLDIEIGGEVVKEDDSVVPYKNTVLAYTKDGKNELVRDMQERVRSFVSTKNALKEAGSGGKGRRLNLRAFAFTLYGFVPAGGCSKKGDKKGLKLLPGGFPVMVIGETLGYADKTKNNCLFRSIYFMLSGESRRRLKEMVPRPSDFKKGYGLHSSDPVPLDIALRMTDDLGIQLGITVIEGGRETRFVSEHYRSLRYRYYDVEIALSVEEGHYYPYLDGALPVSEDVTGKVKGRTINFECATCGETEDYEHYVEHMREHKSEREAFLRSFRRTNPLLPKEEGESDDDYSQRSTEYYLNTIYDYHDSEHKHDVILWFCGPGGCGKSYVIHQLVEREGDDKVFRLAYTGTASAAIGGMTTMIWYKLALRKKMENLPEFVVIDEISMMSAAHFDDVIKMIRKTYGNVSIIIMGDLLQLQPIVEEDVDVNLRLPCVSPIFQDQVFCVPMTYGFRYPDKGFYDFLLNLRMGRLYSEQFMNQGFTVKSRSQIINDYDVSNRPMILTMDNQSVTEFCADIQRLERNREMHRISTLSFELVLNKGQDEENQHSQLGGPPKDVMRRLARDLFKAEVNDIKVITRPPKKDDRYIKSTDSNDYGCEICMEFTEFYYGQKLMVLKNYCGTDRALRNGDEVTFVREDEGGMVVREKGGREVRIQRYWRYVDPPPFVRLMSLSLGKSYPVKPLYASTIDKSQGATYDTIAIYIPRNCEYTRIQLFYVAISRCRWAEKIIFVVDDFVYNRFANDRVRLRHVYELLCKKLVKVNKLCQMVMEWAEKEERSLSEFEELRCGDQVYDEAIFPSNNDVTYWNPRIPKSSRRLKNIGYKDHLLNDFVLFDIETGAASGFEDHPRFFDKDGKWIMDNGKDRLKQAWWMVGAIHYYDRKVVCCATTPGLERFAPYQTGPNGELIFQRGDLDDGSDNENEWCSRIFFEYLLTWMRYRKKRIEDRLKKKARREQLLKLLTDLERAPTYLCGFNSDSFDILGILQQFAFHNGWQEEFNVNITPNSCGSITQLTISTPVNNRKNMWRALASHDIFRLLGRMGRLSNCHKSYVSQYKDNVDGFIKQLSGYSTSQKFKAQMRGGVNLGKGMFPHFVTQRQGFRAALDDTVREYKLEDFPEGDREELQQNPELLRLSLRQVSRQYMLQDLWSTLALYVCFDIQLQKKLTLSTLHLSTAQQLTTARFLHESLGGDFVVSKKCNIKTGRDEFVTTLPIYPAHTNRFIEEAIYGGKTQPRVRFWESEDPETDYYMGGDVGGLYSFCQQEFAYPHGKYLHTAEERYCQAVMKQWELARSFGSDYLMFPENSRFPYPFIARVRLRMPAILTDSGIPFREEDGSINWGIGENGERYQVLTNVHLAMAMDDGAELLGVTEIVFWQRQSKGMAGYIEKLNYEKYGTDDPGARNFAKLLANAFYGSTLKRAHHSIVHITKEGGGKALDAIMKIIERQGCNIQFNPNGTLRIQAELKDDGSRMSDRSTHLGAWVLGYSHHVTHRVIRIARGETHLPTTKAAMREAILRPILYSDTDSAYFHKTHLDRILLWEATQTPDNYVLYQNPERNSEPLAKLGKYADEWEPDDPGYLPDFAAGKLVKVLRFASNAPKSYTAYGVTPTGKEIWKSRCKGIPVFRARLWMSDADEKTEEGVKFDPKSPHVHDFMWQAICSPELYLKTKADQCIKRHGMIVRKHETLQDADDGLHRADPWDIAINNVQRRISKHDGEDLKWDKRRRLTDDEAAFFGLNERQQLACLVPRDFNYDGSVFDLV